MRGVILAAVAAVAVVLSGQARDSGAQPAAPGGQAAVEVPDGGTVTLDSGFAALDIKPLKTDKGRAVRVKAKGVTIDAPRVQLRAQGKTYEIRPGERDGLDVRDLP